MTEIGSFLPTTSSSAPRNPYARHTKSAGQTPSSKVVLGVIAAFTVGCVVLWRTSSMPSMTSMTTDSKVAVPRFKGASAVDPHQLGIMTFNLRFAGANDGHNGWRYRKDHVANIINRYHPAIMGTQEGLKDQLADLHDLLSHPYERYGIERETNGEFEQIFYDTSVVEWLDGGNFWLSDSPDTPGTKGWDAACVRLVTWCKFRLHATGQELFFFNTQLDHEGARARTMGSQLLHERMQEIAGADSAVFLVGDFNTYRHTSTYSYLTAAKEGPKLLEAWPEAENQIGDVSYTYHGWAGIQNDGEKTAKRAANHIDWILYRPKMRVLSTEVITESRNSRYPSDHYPIHAEVMFPPVTQVAPSS